MKYMKLKIKLCLFFIFVNLFCYSQDSGSINYFQKSGNNIDKGVLYFNKSFSLYKTIKSKKEDILNKKQGDGSVLIPSNTIDSIANKPRFILFDRSLGKFYYNNINGDKEMLTYDFKKISWTLLSEHKKILGYNCNKAEGFISDVKYTVWYSPEISLPYGPLKINGLKGVILEITDDMKSLELKATKISFSNVDNVIEDNLRNYDLNKAITKQDYDKELEKHLQDIELRLNFEKKLSEKIIFKRDCEDCNK